MKEKVFADDFQMNFLKEEDFLNFISEREANSYWKRYQSNELRFFALDNNIISNNIQYQLKESEIPVFEDTMKHTRLILKVTDKIYPVRSCAVKSILERAKVSGNALNKVEKNVLARILNYCMEVASGEALLRFCEDKISAVHGGDPSDYAVLATPELFRKTVEYLQNNFTGYIFAGASYDHSIATALWELSDDEDLIKKYKKLLEKSKIYDDIVKVGLRLTTSDTGYSGANLYPLLFIGDNSKILPLGSPLKLEHKNGAVIKDFDNQLNLLYSHYSKAIGGLQKLTNITLFYPLNAMLCVMKKIGVPKKLAYEAMDIFIKQNGDFPCTAYEAYIGISEVINILQSESISGSKIVRTEENISRAVHIRWKDYDIPGELKW